jgi:hypothetical protein
MTAGFQRPTQSQTWSSSTAKGLRGSAGIAPSRCTIIRMASFISLHDSRVLGIDATPRLRRAALSAVARNAAHRTLLPTAIEHYVAADASVRGNDAFVDGLDMIGLGFGRSVPFKRSHFLFLVRAFVLLAMRFDFNSDDVGLIALISLGATGEPRPVQGSQPALATKLPLFP